MLSEFSKNKYISKLHTDVLLNSWLIVILLTINFNALFAQNKAIDVQHYHFEIFLNDSNNIIRGKAGIDFRIKKTARMVSFDLTGHDDSTGKGMKVSRVSENNIDLKFTQDKIII